MAIAEERINTLKYRSIEIIQSEKKNSRKLGKKNEQSPSEFLNNIKQTLYNWSVVRRERERINDQKFEESMAIIFINLVKYPRYLANTNQGNEGTSY